MTSTVDHNPYSLTGPCRNCPFRRDHVGVVRPERAAQIAQALRDGSEFTCHKTTVPDADDEGAMVAGPKAMFCGGALATMEAGGEANQIMRIAERIGLYDASKLDRSAVFGSVTEWVRAHRGDDEAEMSHCDVVGPDCIDPPGFAGFSGVHENADPGTCDPEDDECGAGCGKVCCSECKSGVIDEFSGRAACVYCAEQDDDDWLTT